MDDLGSDITIGQSKKIMDEAQEELDRRAKKKKKKKSPGALGGKIKNRNMGGVIGGGLASQDVTDYLYKYDS